MENENWWMIIFVSFSYDTYELKSQFRLLHANDGYQVRGYAEIEKKKIAVFDETVFFYRKLNTIDKVNLKDITV